MENDNRQLNEEQRAALVEFTEDKDRGKAAIFVGRKAELVHVQACVNRLLRRQGKGESAPGIDLTTVIQGAPGAGKSALLARIKEEWPPGGDGPAVAVSLDPGALKLPMPDFLKAVVSRAEQAPGFGRILGKYIRSISVSMSGVINLEIGAASAQFSGKPVAPVILLFDEIQTELAFSASAQSREHLIQNLRLLHTGEHGAPMFPVYGGLADSANLLRSAGLTRLALDSEWTLARFCDQEIDELMIRFADEHLSSAGPSQAIIDHWGKVFHRDSQGWPMHCRNFLIALCEEIRKKDWQPDAVDLDTVRMRAQQLRFMYYAQRMQGNLDERFVLVSRVLEEMRRNAPNKRGQIVEWIAKAHQDSPGEGFGWGSLPHGMTAEQAFDAMLHAGIIQKTGKGKFTCPVPSLASYIAARATLPPSPLHEAVLDNEAADMDHALDLCGDDEERAKLLQAADMRGRTPLMLAVELSMVAMVEYMVQVESRLPVALRTMKHKDNTGRTARDYAVASGNERIAALLDQLRNVSGSSVI